MVGSRIIYLEDLAARTYKAGWRGDDWTTANAVFVAESGDKDKDGRLYVDASAVGVNGDGSRDRGIAQINSKAHPQVTDAMAFDPNYNLAYAFKLWQQRKWQPWSAWKNGRHEQYMAASRQVTAGGAPLGAAQSFTGTLTAQQAGALVRGAGWGLGDVPRPVPGTPNVEGQSEVGIPAYMALYVMHATSGARVDAPAGLWGIGGGDADAQAKAAHTASKGGKDWTRFPAAARYQPPNASTQFADAAINATAPGPSVGDVIEGAGDLLSLAPPWELLARLLSTLLSPEFWRRTGLIIAGALLVLGAGALLFLDLKKGVT